MEQRQRAMQFIAAVPTHHRLSEVNMLRRALSLSLTLAALAITPAALHAQNPNPLADRFTLSAAFGGLSGAARSSREA